MVRTGTLPAGTTFTKRPYEGRCLLATCGRLEIIKCVFCVTSACFVMYVCLQKCVFSRQFFKLSVGTHTTTSRMHDARMLVARSVHTYCREGGGRRNTCTSRGSGS